MADIPRIGDVVADFRLPGGRLVGETVHRGEYILCEQRGTALVLAVYPGDDTPVRTAQLCSYNDGLAQLGAAGAAVRGISPKASTATNTSPD
ncbi:hypothetical protein GCM10010347_42440 [Streptomyces cirratus]|uniref:Alkyl hydroperoxide reductase subunit C/ Thiol specific antioxidant domain-containing protein n=1 Tax=Streptomyces cirratus TaxID=68187 RepID=A0ABQ3EZ00_9ACTN|nr:hypothetical protein GCM10010347_42440 [Streptomyces cirratus]